jgi:hypothetical protein
VLSPSTEVGQLDASSVDVPSSSVIADTLASIREALPDLEGDDEATNSQVHGRQNRVQHPLLYALACRPWTGHRSGVFFMPQVCGHSHGFGHVLQPIFTDLSQKWAADVALRRWVEEQRAGAYAAGKLAAETSLVCGSAGKVDGTRVMWRTVPVAVDLGVDLIPRLVSLLSGLNKLGMLEHDPARDANFLVCSPGPALITVHKRESVARRRST